MDKLNRLLQDWAKKQQTEQFKLDSLTANICQNVRGIEPGTAQKAFEPKIVPLWGVRIAYTSLGLAAACLVFMIINLQQQQIPTPVKKIASGDTRGHCFDRNVNAIFTDQCRFDSNSELMAALSQEDIDNDLKVIQELRHVFPENLKWIQTSNHEMKLGLASQQEMMNKSGDYIKVNLIIFKRTGSEDWQKVWTTEVTAVPEEFIQIPLNGETGGSISLWGYHLPDGLLAVDSDIRLKSPVEMTTSFSGIFKPGKPQQVLSLKSADTEYCVFETVNYLKIKTQMSI